MMKKHLSHSIKIVLFLIFFIFLIWAITRGSSIKPSTQITVPSHTIYLDGNNAIPDSVMIITRYNGAIVYSAWFNSGDAEATADSGELVFTDQLQDIDGGGGDGHYVITARAYDLDSTLYTNWHYTFEVGLADDAEDALDTLKNHDNWVAKEATVQIIDDSIDVYDDAGHFQADIQDVLDTLQNQDDWVASETNVTEILDTLKTYDEAGRFQLDIQEVLDTLQVYDNANQLRPEIAAILDTLQNQDNWIASETNVTEVLDTLKLHDDWVAKEATATEILDTLKLYDNWIAHQTTVDSAGAIVWANVDTAATIDTSDIGDWFINNSSADFTSDERDSIKWAYRVVIDSLANPSDVWVDIDTAATIDTSDIGAWFVNNVGGGNLTNITDTVNAILDTLQNHDDWVASETNVTEVLDTLKTYDNAGRFQLDIQEILDTLQVYDNANQLRPEVATILDTLQNQDDWIATSSNQTVIIDTVNGIMDTLQNQDNWVSTLTIADMNARNAIGDTIQRAAAIASMLDAVKDTVNATLDTLQLQDDWVSSHSATDVWNIAFNTGFNAGSMGDSLNNATYVQGDVSGISDIADTTNAILDTIQAHAPHGNDWGQGGGNLTAITDTVNAILDTLQLWDDDIAYLVVIRDSVNAILDTLQLWDDDVALLIAMRDSINATLDTLQAGFGSRSAIGDTTQGVDEVYAEIENIDAWNPITDNDSLIVDQSTMAAGQKNDSLEIRRWVWDDTTTHDSTGTMGKALNDAASCNPSGSNTITITLKRDSDSTAIIGHQVEVKTDGTTYYINQTDNDGKVQFSSDNDTLFVYPHTHGIAFNSPETLYIDGNEDTTYYGTPYSPSSPPADTLCVVYVYVKTAQGVAIQNAKVKIWGAASNVKYGNVVIDYQKEVTEKTDANGRAEFSEGFYPNDVLTPNDLLYHYRIETSHFIAEGSFEVPIADSYELVIEQ